MRLTWDVMQARAARDEGLCALKRPLTPLAQARGVAWSCKGRGVVLDPPPAPPYVIGQPRRPGAWLDPVRRPLHRTATAAPTP